MSDRDDQPAEDLGVWCQTGDGVFVKLSHQDGGLLLMVELLTREAAEAIDAQIKATSSLLMPLRERAPLNANIAICLQIPATGTEHWMEGRVVLSSPLGLGLELRPAEPETFALRWRAAVSSLVPGMRTPVELRDQPRTPSPSSRRVPLLDQSPRRRFLKHLSSPLIPPPATNPDSTPPPGNAETPSSRPRPPSEPSNGQG